MTLLDSRICELGEGPLWHPERGQLFWFDILGKRMLSTDGLFWDFDEHVSAAGWVDRDTLLIASETALLRFDLANGDSGKVVALEADNPVTRSNDGRADPWGGFWIGTMGKAAEPGAGAIYRYYRGTLRQLFSGAHIPNATCFAPDRSCAYFTGLTTGVVMRQPLGPQDGWPTGSPVPFLDLRGSDGQPDGAVTDADGNIWLARWGGARVSVHGPDGAHLRDIALPASQITCPAFGGADLRSLLVTSATEGMTPEALALHPHNGCTFEVGDMARGLPEPQVIL